MIYFVEDDNSIRKLVLYSLTSAGLEAEGFAHPSEFWAAMNRQIPQVVLLDIMLPEEDGISILKKLRADGRRQPHCGRPYPYPAPEAGRGRQLHPDHPGHRL